jgi:hypothetical protein
LYNTLSNYELLSRQSAAGLQIVVDVYDTPGCCNVSGVTVEAPGLPDLLTREGGGWHRTNPEITVNGFEAKRRCFRSKGLARMDVIDPEINPFSY